MQLIDLTDLVYPRLAGSARSRQEEADNKWREIAESDELAVDQLESDHDDLKEYSKEVDKMLDREQSRKQSVESRLTSIIGLSSIAATVVVSGLFALAAGALNVPPGAASWILAFGCLYVVAQLFIALFAAIKGLSRAATIETTASDLFATQKAAPRLRTRGQIASKLAQLRDQRRAGDERVSQMAVSHQAVRNFLFGLLLLAATAAWFAANRPAPSVNATASNIAAPAGIKAEPGSSSPSAAVPAPPAADGSVIPLVALSLGVALLVAGSMFLIAGKPIRNVALGSTLMLAGGGLSLFGGTKVDLQLGRIDKLIGELRIHLFEKPAPTAQARISLMRLATIGPFPDGGHELTREPILQCLLGRLTPDFVSSVGGWQIVGRVDKRQLRPDRALLYGSNQSLAMTRANWVRDEILMQIQGFRADASIVSVGGAGRVGAKVDASDMQSDRRVDLYIFATQPDTKTATAIKPLDCPGV